MLSSEHETIIQQLKPEYADYMRWFLRLTTIPHETYHCDELSKAIFQWISEMGITPVRFDNGNIIARIPGEEGKPVVAIQAHIDMVWVGEAPIKAVLKDGIISAPKSTLGADDGFGVALMLEMIQKRDSFTHPPMEFIFTVDEEKGLQGVRSLPKAGDPEQLTAKYLINCDSLTGEAVFVGSAGGIMFLYDIPLHRESITSTKVSIHISGLLGGHSGNCIHLNRANAIKEALRFIEPFQIKLINFNGGRLINIIADEATVEFAVEAPAMAIEPYIESEIEALKIDFPQEKELNVTFSIEENQPVSVIKESDALINIVKALRQGPIRYHPVFKESVETSQNVSQFHTDGDVAKFEIFTRTSSFEMFEKMKQEVEGIFSGIQLENNSRQAGIPWEPNPDSKLAQMMVKAFEEETGRHIPIRLIHVTIEPPEIKKLGYTDLQMIAVCPSIPLAHSIGEWMNVEEAMEWKRAIHRLLNMF